MKHNVQLVHGVKLIAENDMVINHMKRMNQPEFEPQSMGAWLSSINPGCTTIDVGSYTGLYAIAAAKAGADSYAFEPNPFARERALENIGINCADVTMFMSAVGDSPGQASFSMRHPLTSAGQIGGDGGKKIAVEVVSIDSLEFNNVSGIKIDVEGYEAKVIQGAINTIREHRPLIIAEALNEASISELFSIMEKEGYSGEMADQRNILFRYVR